MLPIASWERRFIDMAQGNDAGQSGGEVEVGSGEDGSAGGGAGQTKGDDSDFGVDGLYGMMLMSSTHHRYAGLFTIRKPGAPAVTQLLVRGSSQHGQKPVAEFLAAAKRVLCCTASTVVALGSLLRPGMCGVGRVSLVVEASRIGAAAHCGSLLLRAGSDEENMADLLMYSTNYTVCRRSVCL